MQHNSNKNMTSIPPADPPTITTATSITDYSHLLPTNHIATLEREGSSSSSDHEQVWGHMMQEMDDAIMSGEFYPAVNPAAAETEDIPPPLLTAASRTDSITSTTLCVNPHEIQPQLLTTTVHHHHHHNLLSLGNSSSNPAYHHQQQQLQHNSQQTAAGGHLHDVEETEQQQHRLQHHHNQQIGQDVPLHQHSSSSDRRQSVSEEILPDYGHHGPSSNYSTASSNSNPMVEEDQQQQQQQTYIIQDQHANLAYHVQLNTETHSASFLKEEDQDSNMTGDFNAGSSSHSNSSSSLDQQQQVARWPAAVLPTISINNQRPLVITGSQPTSTGRDVPTINYPGQYLFEVQFVSVSGSGTAKNKHWAFSTKLNKLFVDMNRWVQVQFRVGPHPPAGLLIRTLPVYGEPAHMREPVLRCPLHANLKDDLNGDFPYVHHLIRFQSEYTEYDEDSQSGRLSAVLPVHTPHQGTDYCPHLMKFMCLGSDPGGINRRPVRIVFTLEQDNKVVGRKVVELRICSCPKRDLQQEEARCAQQEENARRIAQKFAASTTIPAPTTTTAPLLLMPPPGKKLKMMESNSEAIVMVPVHCEDFKKLNEFAEAAWVCRDPANADTIRETRRRLLQQHNTELMKRLEKKPKKN